ncbi:unnamed protein product [Ceutorhynchus assimilis]|uniref:Uncharacterized protein n=1 Tax=Ceutorhynchus assimilis TaxID=467358 RepID=A0A9N9QNX1_9CUCU|nr:unnamed protein product [Ceutorhynchus assimilis]
MNKSLALTLEEQKRQMRFDERMTLVKKAIDMKNEVENFARESKKLQLEVDTMGPQVLQKQIDNKMLETQKKEMEKNIKDKLMVVLRDEKEVSFETALQIEKNTRKQANCKMWHAERKYRITASSVGQICWFTEKRDKKAFAQGLIDPKPLNTPPIIWGKSKEVMAKDGYQQKTGNNIQQCANINEKTEQTNECPWKKETNDNTIAIGTQKLEIAAQKRVWALRGQIEALELIGNCQTKKIEKINQIMDKVEVVFQENISPQAQEHNDVVM